MVLLNQFLPVFFTDDWCTLFITHWPVELLTFSTKIFDSAHTMIARYLIIVIRVIKCRSDGRRRRRLVHQLGGNEAGSGSRCCCRAAQTSANTSESVNTKTVDRPMTDAIIRRVTTARNMGKNSSVFVQESCSNARVGSHQGAVVDVSKNGKNADSRDL